MTGVCLDPPQPASEADCLQWCLPNPLQLGAWGGVRELTASESPYFPHQKFNGPAFKYFLQTAKANSLGSFSQSFLSVLRMQTV